MVFLIPKIPNFAKQKEREIGTFFSTFLCHLSLPARVGKEGVDGNESAECNKHQKTLSKKMLKMKFSISKAKSAPTAGAAAGTGHWGNAGAGKAGIQGWEKEFCVGLSPE